jgi:hypothetical protein
MLHDEKTDRGVPPGYELLGPLDQATVRQLVLGGADMKRPRHVLHSLSFPTAEANERTRLAVESAGWHATASHPDGDDRWMLTCEKDDYVLLARLIHADSQFFDGLARKGGGAHEGWEASLSN